MALTGTATINAADVNRTIYGYVNTDDNHFGTYGIVSAQTNDLEATEMLYDFMANNVNPAYAATGYDNIIYAFTYQWNGSMVQPTASDLVAYNISTGRMTTIGPWSPNDPNLKVQDATWDPVDNALYTIIYTNEQSYLSKVNLETGALETVCEILSDISFVAVASSPAGVLYGLGIDGIIYRVNKTSGALAEVFNSHLTQFYVGNSMIFDPASGNLFWAIKASDYDPNNTILVEVDLNAEGGPKMHEVGQIGRNSVFNGLYMPGASSYAAPAAPTDFTATYTSGKLEAKLSWTNPSTTFGNDVLTDLNGIVVRRDGKQVAVVTDVTPGSTSEWIDDTLTEGGEYRYDIFAIGTGGEGMTATSFAFVGQDYPDAVTSPLLEIGDAYTSATISWDAVTKGFHNGDFDAASVKYDVIRRPDNKVVATDVTATTATDDQIIRTLPYYYEVIAKNEIGSAPAAATRSLILGPAIETPFTEDFDTEAEVLTRWMIQDANADYRTWMINTSAGHTFFGDYETAIEYMVSPIDGGPYYDADDWLISGPLAFDKDTAYEVALECRSIAPEKVEIYVGPSEDIEDLELCGSIDIQPSQMIEGDTSVRGTMYTLPINTKDLAVGSVAIRLVTPAADVHYNFFQICTAKVCEEGTGYVAAPATDTLQIRINGDLFEVAGEMTGVDFFNAAGAKVMTSAANTTDLTALAKGIYMAVVKTAQGSKTVKFAK